MDDKEKMESFIQRKSFFEQILIHRNILIGYVNDLNYMLNLYGLMENKFFSEQMQLHKQTLRNYMNDLDKMISHYDFIIDNSELVDRSNIDEIYHITTKWHLLDELKKDGLEFSFSSKPN